MGIWYNITREWEKILIHINLKLRKIMEKEIIGWEISAEEIIAEAFRQEAAEERFEEWVSEQCSEEE